MDDIIKECVKLEEKYGKMPFDEALPYLQKGWWQLADKHNTTGDKIFRHYMDWKAEQQK